MLTFLSFNIGKFRKEQVQKLVKYLLPANADCIGLQEVDWVDDSATVITLQQALNLPYVTVGYSINTSNHVLMLARFPITHRRSFESFANAGLLASIEVEQRSTSVALVHLASRPEHARIDELSMLLESLQKPADNVIVMGDFNAVSKNDPVEYRGKLTEPILYDATFLLSEARFVDVGATVAKTFIPTVPITRDGTATYTNLRLDYLYLSAPLTEQKLTYAVLDPKDVTFPSDHRAIVVTISVDNSKPLQHPSGCL